MEKLYMQYGCGHSAPKNWLNFDASPTLRIQKITSISKIFKSKLNTIFPENVRYGDIVKGLPLDSDSCDGIYCSHILEHLSLHDFRIALKNTFKILKVGGIFRCIEKWTPWTGRRFVKVRCKRTGVNHPTRFLIALLKYTSSGVYLSSD